MVADGGFPPSQIQTDVTDGQCQLGASNIKLTEQTCHLVGFLLLDGLIVQRLEEHVQHQDVVSGKQKKKQLKQFKKQVNK